MRLTQHALQSRKRDVLYNVGRRSSTVNSLCKAWATMDGLKHTSIVAASTVEKADGTSFESIRFDYILIPICTRSDGQLHTASCISALPIHLHLPKAAPRSARNQPPNNHAHTTPAIHRARFICICTTYCVPYPRLASRVAEMVVGFSQTANETAARVPIGLVAAPIGQPTDVMDARTPLPD